MSRMRVRKRGGETIAKHGITNRPRRALEAHSDTRYEALVARWLA